MRANMWLGVSRYIRANRDMLAVNHKKLGEICFSSLFFRPVKNTVYQNINKYRLRNQIELKRLSLSNIKLIFGWKCQLIPNEFNVIWCKWSVKATCVSSANWTKPELWVSWCCSSLCRYIELSNGLQALLISDFSRADGTGGGENGEEDEDEGEEERGEEEGDSGEGSEEDEEEDEEEERDSDFDELEEESAGKKKRGSSEKQVGDEAPFPLNVLKRNIYLNFIISTEVCVGQTINDVMSEVGYLSTFVLLSSNPITVLECNIRMRHGWEIKANSEQFIATQWKLKQNLS